MKFLFDFIGGPGCGKSTLAAGLYKYLKQLHYDVGLITEYATQLVAENNMFALSKQYYVTNVQLYQQELAENIYDYVITDSSILLGNIYNTESSPILKDMMNMYWINKYREKNVYTIYVQRQIDKYSDIGRRHQFNDSIDIDKKILKLLDTNKIPYYTFNIDNNHEELFLYIHDMLRNNLLIS